MGAAGMGRPTKPTGLKLLHGDRKDRINTSEPTPSTSEVRCPSWLSTSAKRIWRQYAPDLRTQNVLTSWDVEHFAVWCHAVSRRRQAVAELEHHGEVIETPVFDKKGEPLLDGGEPIMRMVRSPWSVVLKEATETMQRYGARFGLTPSDRASLHIPGADDEDAVSALMS